ncbi:MAG TPA: 50S ribosomal protein L11 methyltransferase [Longimicrobiales bacterium]|nr:50S ribosomal protein L11 methyltransferase [Longimicrobiales bacterium]
MSHGPDRWLVILVSSPSDELRHVLSEGLVASGGSAVVEEGEMLTTWLPEPADIGLAVGSIRSRLEAAAGQPVELRVEVRQSEDWLGQWRDGLAPRRVGNRIIVAPSWTRPQTGSPDDIVIVIDPQMAFGTGEHASTRGALRMLEHVITAGMTLLDVGAGSAVLAIAAARLGAARVVAVESDDSAIENARDNIESNGCTDRITLEHGEVDETWLANHAALFDVIVANVLSGVLRPLLPAFRRSVGQGGWIILGGILEEEAADVKADAAAASFRPDREEVEAGWWTGCFRGT